jgi:hypothetical protein
MSVTQFVRYKDFTDLRIPTFRALKLQLQSILQGVGEVRSGMGIRVVWTIFASLFNPIYSNPILSQEHFL